MNNERFLVTEQPDDSQTNNDDMVEEWLSETEAEDYSGWGGFDEWPEFDEFQKKMQEAKESEEETPRRRVLEESIKINDSMETEFDKDVDRVIETAFVRHRETIKPGEKSEKAKQDAMQLYYSLSNRGEVLPAIVQADSETIEAMMDDYHYFANELNGIDGLEEIDGARWRTIEHECRWMLAGYYEFYNSKNVRAARNSLVDRMKEKIEDSGEEKLTVTEVNRALEIASQSKELDAFDLYLDYYSQLKQDPNNSKDSSVYKRSDLLENYCVGHGFNEQVVQGFKINVLPMMDMEDSEVDSLTKPTANSFGSSVGEFGISDYTIHALASEVNPKNTRDLMHIYREIPTSDYVRFEQNRCDALALMGVLWDGRDFIHDERPGIHELLSAMVEYYDSRDDTDYEDKKAKLQNIVASRLDPENRYLYTGFDGKKCFDLGAYERIVHKDENDLISVHYDLPAIDILRRLEQNTRQTSLEKPITDDELLNDLLGKLDPYEKNNGEVLVDWKQITDVVARVNEILTNNQGKIGMRPSFVKALSYIEKMATYVMRGVDRKEYRELPFDPGFKELCKFSELTSSNEKFDEREFEMFWNRFVSEAGNDWPNRVENSYQMLAQRVTKRLNGLALQYKKDGWPRHMTDSLWSGNLNHELIGLVDER